MARAQRPGDRPRATERATGKAEWTNKMSNLTAMQGSNTLLIVSSDDLKEFAFSIIEEAKKMAMESERKEKYLTEAEVCKILNVTHTTLWRWNKKGDLKSRKIGRRKMWALSEIENLMKEG